MNHRDARTAEMSVGTRMLTEPVSKEALLVH